MRSNQGSARERLLRAALELFSEHGVSGTSLQMIADRLGVTKAAVYHQFQSKDDIVLAVIDPPLARLAPIADAAEQQRTDSARLQTTLSGIVDLVVEFRHESAVLSFDPVVSRLVRGHPAMDALQRIRRLLLGPAPDAGTRVRVGMLSGGLIMVGTDPDLAAVDDEELRRHLLGTLRRLLNLRVRA